MTRIARGLWVSLVNIGIVLFGPLLEWDMLDTSWQTLVFGGLLTVLAGIAALGIVREWMNHPQAAATNFAAQIGFNIWFLLWALLAPSWGGMDSEGTMLVIFSPVLLLFLGITFMFYRELRESQL